MKFLLALATLVCATIAAATPAPQVVHVGNWKDTYGRRQLDNAGDWKDTHHRRQIDNVGNWKDPRP
ncbi:hypothetical protein GGH92_008879 [Coemansia sp. RSA 2673]|nr:hypothetical protein GGH92_008879 [Coemansia sp. RSA 2673]